MIKLISNALKLMVVFVSLFILEAVIILSIKSIYIDGEFIWHSTSTWFVIAMTFLNILNRGIVLLVFSLIALRFYRYPLSIYIIAAFNFFFLLFWLLLDGLTLDLSRVPFLVAGIISSLLFVGIGLVVFRNLRQQSPPVE